MSVPLTDYQAKYFAHELQRSYANDHVGNPVGGGGSGDAKIAAFQRLNFGAQYPNQRTGTHGKTDNKHQQHVDGEILR